MAPPVSTKTRLGKIGAVSEEIDGVITVEGVAGCPGAGRGGVDGTTSATEFGKEANVGG